MFAQDERLPREEYYIDKSGDTLKMPLPLFGRDIFRRKDLTFAPDLNLPTPTDYQLSSGDEVRINIWGNSEMDDVQIISPEGRIFIEGVGPIQLSGLTVKDAESKVRRELTKIFKGLSDGSTSLSLSLGKIRSINVNVVGEAYMPGTYTLPSLATLFNALYMAGGVNDIGSLRSIKLYRDNREVTTLDVYDYLLNGNSESNVRLESGDMIIVQPYESLVTAEGELKRNRIFELRSGETLADLLTMAGGFKGSANTANVEINRKRDSYYVVRRVKSDDFATVEMYDGDMVKVDSVAQRYLNRLDIEGAVWYPGVYEFGDDVHTVRQLIDAASGLKGDEFAGRAQITRLNPDFSRSVIAIDIQGIMNGREADVELMKDDVLYIPSLYDLREEYKITVSGAVNDAQELDFRYNMTVEDAIILAGGLKEDAAMVNVDISRRVKSPKLTGAPSQIVEVFNVELVDGLALDKSGLPVILEPFDEVYVRYSPGYRSQEVVSIDGEVLFKGDYVLKSVNSRISDILVDAGGVTEESYVRGASLTRMMSEDEMIRVRAMLDLARSDSGRDSLEVDNIDINRYSVGIDLEAIMKNPGGQDDIVLRDGDVLFIPKMQSTVKISGAVVYPNSVTYLKKMSAKRYIEQAGGYSDYAKKRPIVVYMNGKVATTKRGFFFVKNYPKIEPGCEVLVASKRNRERSSLAETMSIATSAVSMAAIVASIL